MAAKSVFLFCATALMAKLVAASCNNNAFDTNNFLNIGSNVNNGFAVNNNVNGNAVYGLGNIAANNGGSLTVQSFSPIAPTGVSVESTNNLEGAIVVDGNLPFLSVVALEGQVASNGQGNVAYSSGNGNVGIVSENLGPNVAVNGLAYGQGIANAGYANAGVANAGYANAGVANAGYANAGVANGGYANLGNVGVAGNCNGLY